MDVVRAAYPVSRRAILVATAGATAAVLAPLPAQGRSHAPRLDVDAFVELSVVLTGLEDLDDDVGETYLDRLLEDGREADLRRLLEAAGPEPSLRRLRDSGALDDPALGELAETIATYWYTGVIDTPTGPQVVTWVEAGAWLALEHFAEPPTVELGKEEWADRP